MFKKRTLSPQEIKQAERVRKAKDTLLEFQAPEGLFQKCNCCGKPVAVISEFVQRQELPWY